MALAELSVVHQLPAQKLTVLETVEGFVLTSQVAEWYW
jgi:hypothetical protein